MSITKQRKEIFLILSLFFITISLRIPFVSKTLYDWDSIQFALATKNFNPALQYPHPPGYILYVYLGKLVNLFFKDVNLSFLTINIFFSALLTIILYLLVKEMFGKLTGIIASLFYLTAPLFWFQSEVALSYILGSFFACSLAFLCFKILKGGHQWIFLSSVILGVLGGIRQSLLIFMLPLWLFSIKKVNYKKILLSLFLLAVVCLAWFIPTCLASGGINNYMKAIQQQTRGSVWPTSIFQHGIQKLFRNLLVIVYSTMFNIEFVIIFAIIFIITISLFTSREKLIRILSFHKREYVFLSFWILPSLLFYLFIHVNRPGHCLSFALPLLIIAAYFVTLLLKLLLKRQKSSFKREKIINISIIFILCSFNIFSFLFGAPFSYAFIKSHDQKLTKTIETIKCFPSEKTIILISKSKSPLTFRHAQYYLTRYQIYEYFKDPSVIYSKGTNFRFSYFGKEKFVSEINIPPGTEYIVFPKPLEYISDPLKKLSQVSLQTEIKEILYLNLGNLKTRQSLSKLPNINLQDK